MIAITRDIVNDEIYTSEKYMSYGDEKCDFKKIDLFDYENKNVKSFMKLSLDELIAEKKYQENEYNREMCFHMLYGFVHFKHFSRGGLSQKIYNELYKFVEINHKNIDYLDMNMEICNIHDRLKKDDKMIDNVTAELIKSKYECKLPKLNRTLNYLIVCKLITIKSMIF